MWVAIAVAASYVGWTFLARHQAGQRWKTGTQRAASAAREADFQRTYGGSDLRILQFYPRESVVFEGGNTVVCYGVLNARAVRIDPPIESLAPSLNRCVEAAPERTTRYTLTAEGAGGTSATASFEIEVRPDPEALPRITYFRADSARVEDGKRIVKLVWGQVNGDLVEVDPPVFPALHGTPMGQFYVAPRETTTYTLTVTGKHGHKARKSLKVDVQPA
jgi:hypothetical protein